MPLTDERLHEIVNQLMSRPGHETVRTRIDELLIHGLGATATDISYERPLPEVHGRLDGLLGRTIFEYKSDLRRERADAEEELTRYLSDRESNSGEHFIGIATDGAQFITYELSDGAIRELQVYVPSRDAPRDLLSWLSAAVVIEAEIPPDPDIVERELGRASLAFNIARVRLSDLWESVAEEPEVLIKRQMWAGLLEMVYGSPIDDDRLFLQHTYLTIVAKTMAASVLGIQISSPRDLLSGRPFTDAGVYGAIESDFFDWVFNAEGSEDLVKRIATQVQRFRLRDIDSDVLKGLYESLIDPEQRHYLGEYYTPDWLAARICERAIGAPLDARVLDPACGSGTFLFHAARRLLDAADASGLSNDDALQLCTTRVIGVDVHPVAVLIARVNYLLAIGQDRLRGQRSAISIPVYMGDSLQWNTALFLTEPDVRIEVPQGPTLLFPARVASNPQSFDSVIQSMLDLSDEGRRAPPDDFEAWVRQDHSELEEYDVGMLKETYSHLLDLREQGRDHIWGFVARNLSRPIWLSSENQKADVVIGNPPWLSYRYMSRNMQQRFREESQRRGIWAGGNVATHQDLSAYFFARSVELYLKPSGTIAFVMPYAAMSRRQFEGFRTGWFGSRTSGDVDFVAAVRFTEAWTFDDRVQPLFPVPSCVLFASPIGGDTTASLPRTVTSYSGQLPMRNISSEDADGYLTSEYRPWPQIAADDQESYYRTAFRQGATVVPRMLFTVERTSSGTLGVDPSLPLVRSRRTNLEKAPWRDLDSLRGNIEARFLRPLYLGESIAPFRILGPVEAVIPWDDESEELLDSVLAQSRGYPRLAQWLRQAERLWDQNSRGNLTLSEELDYYGKLTAQMPPSGVRVVYTASGSISASAVLSDSTAVIEHKLYWHSCGADEAHYLTATLGSGAARSRVVEFQSRGQWGTRDFDKLLPSLPIPRYDSEVSLHTEIMQAARRAEELASDVSLPDGAHFTTARRLIRNALAEDGVSQEIDAMVATLLGSES